MRDDAARESGMYGYLASRGISRRSFLKFCGGLAVAIGLTEAMGPRVAEALEEKVESGKLAPVIWLEAGSCTGCTESFAQAEVPSIATVVLDMISLDYCESLSAGAGASLEEAKRDAIEKGGYLLVYEGAVMTGWDGNALRIGGEKGTDILLEAARNAVAVICAGSCAVDGGWMAADPNPAGAMGAQEFLRRNGIVDVPVINLPSCPVNPEAVVVVLVNYLLLDRTIPELDSKNRPVPIFGQFIHENCARRGHFENGEFVYRFGSEEERKGYCLYAMGCRGPQTRSSCSLYRWNRRVSWCVESGAPCCGCAEADPRTTKRNWVSMNAPFSGSRFRDLKVMGKNIQLAPVAAGVAGVVAAAIVVHGFGMKIAGRTKGGPPVEKETEHELNERLYREALEEAREERAREEERREAGGPSDDERGGGAR